MCHIILYVWATLLMVVNDIGMGLVTETSWQNKFNGISGEALH